MNPKKGRIFINRTASLKFMSSPLLTSSYFCTRYSSTVAVQATLKITISSSFYVSGAFAILCYLQINSTYPPSMLCLFIFQNWKSLKQLRMKRGIEPSQSQEKVFHNFTGKRWKCYIVKENSLTNLEAQRLRSMYV